jgi:GTP-binding protein YchF
MSSLSLGLVGLPNVGKSTLFNALVKSSQAQASNYPFCTIDPNVGIVQVPDERLQHLAELVNPAQVVPAAVEFWDIAGIIKGASQGEGLGNQFLANIRQCTALVIVVRCFQHPDVIHVAGKVDPRADLETVLLELMLADLETVQKGLDRYRKNARGGDAVAQACLAYTEKLYAALESEQMASTVPQTTEHDHIALRELQLLTAKPLLLVANIDESQIDQTPTQLYSTYSFGPWITSADQVIPICAQMEAELASLDEAEQKEFLASYNLTESGLDRLAQAAYRLLGLCSFFTAGPKEVKAWTITKGSTAPIAAGVIHTDFIKGFIRAETIAYADYIKYKGEQGAKEAGRLRLEGKEYIVQDGDVMHFRVNA